MTNEGIEQQLRVLLTQIDKELEAAEKALQAGDTARAGADIRKSREHTQESIALVATSRSSIGV